ncbi:hypothetical protein NFI96_019749 [Prochilodus magdalenae]|nr:hypothetical protein NFI96_019749 [Prochilodus magdalenae]
MISCKTGTGKDEHVFRDHPCIIGVLFSVILVVLEKFVEQNFVCPCRSGYTEALFSLYLLTPMAMSFFLRTLPSTLHRR